MTTLIQRKQPLRIVVLRLLFILTVLLITELFRRAMTDYAIFVILIFIFMLFPSLTEITMFEDRVELKKYFLLATITKVHILSIDNRPSVSGFEAVMEADTDPYLLSESLLSFLPVFITPKTVLKYYKFKYNDKGKIKKLTVRLTEEEFRKIATVIAADVQSP